MFNAQNADDMVECPYNKVHRMLRKRLQGHIIKCRLSYPDVELQKCPFNQTHLVPEPEFVYHVTNCSDRKLITQYKYDAPAAEEEEERVKQEPVECDENWDNTEVEDYNPQKHIEKAKVLRQAVGGLPSQRKLFIKEERKRLGDYNSSDEEEDNKQKAKVQKHDCDRPHTSDEEADYVYSNASEMIPPAPINVQWFEDKSGREDDVDSIRQDRVTTGSDIKNQKRRNNRRSRSRKNKGFSSRNDPVGQRERDDIERWGGERLNERVRDEQHFERGRDEQQIDEELNRRWRSDQLSDGQLNDKRRFEQHNDAELGEQLFERRIDEQFNERRLEQHNDRGRNEYFERRIDGQHNNRNTNFSPDDVPHYNRSDRVNIDNVDRHGLQRDVETVPAGRRYNRPFYQY